METQTKPRGRQPIATPFSEEELERIRSLGKSGHSHAAVAEKMGMSRFTLERRLRMSGYELVGSSVWELKKK